ncbi:hypothetical protein [Micromonospora chersina]
MNQAGARRQVVARPTGQDSCSARVAVTVGVPLVDRPEITAADNAPRPVASASMTPDVYAGLFGDDLDAVANRLYEAVAARDAGPAPRTTA